MPSAWAAPDHQQGTTETPRANRGAASSSFKLVSAKHHSRTTQQRQHAPESARNTVASGMLPE
eukprot:6618109-Alexandrium_andersonii.AAC.1